MINPEVLIGLIQNRGPILPIQLKKDVRMDSLLISAMLSNLAHNKKVKLSKLKIGTSPLYYLPGQEALLVNFIEKLPEKERRAVKLLQEHLVLRDSQLDAVTRFCLRQTKDFAEALVVTIGGVKETFWKWYLLSDLETEQKIRNLLTPAPIKQESSLNVTVGEVGVPKSIETPMPKAKPKKKARQSKLSSDDDKLKLEKDSKLAQPVQQPGATAVQQEEEKKEAPVIRAVKAIKEMISPQAESTVLLNEAYAEDPFYVSLITFFRSNGIAVVQEECIRRKSEYDFQIEIQSPVGMLKYYCKAKSKKKLSEGDLSTIFLKAQGKKMPILLLTNGELSKKAQELLESELHGLTVKKF